jgi:hypothetical protein
VGTTNSLLVIKDPQLKKTGRQARAQLRTLPFLAEFGLERVSHPSIYDNGLRLVEYNLIDNETLRDGAVDDVEFPLVHYVTQEMLTGDLQDESSKFDEQDVVRRLLRQRPGNETYVLVTDTSTPQMPRYTRKPGKSFIDEFECSVVDYEGLLKQYLQSNVDSDIPLSATKNLYFHQLSSYHKERELPADSVPKLFDYTTIPSDSPAWGPVYYLVREDADKVLEEYSERVREALRSWTESGPTQKIANSMLDILERVDFEEDRLDEYRNRHNKK